MRHDQNAVECLVSSNKMFALHGSNFSRLLFQSSVSGRVGSGSWSTQITVGQTASRYETRGCCDKQTSIILLWWHVFRYIAPWPTVALMDHGFCALAEVNLRTRQVPFGRIHRCMIGLEISSPAATEIAFDCLNTCTEDWQCLYDAEVLDDYAHKLGPIHSSANHSLSVRNSHYRQ